MMPYELLRLKRKAGHLLNDYIFSVKYAIPEVHNNIGFFIYQIAITGIFKTGESPQNPSLCQCGAGGCRCVCAVVALL